MSPENPREGSRTKALTELTLAVLIGYLGTLSHWGGDGKPFRLNPTFVPILKKIHQMKNRCGPGGRSLLDPGEEFEEPHEALKGIMPKGDLLKMEPVEALRQVMENVDVYVEAKRERR